jgi:ATP-dependent RNA helicase DDX54/DBP10
MAHALNLKKFRQPTPIQRASLPHALASPPRDVLGMARTGSGKTLAYMIPLLQRLRHRLETPLGPRALVLCPNRELALQILRVGKDLNRGMSGTTDANDAKLQWALTIGGEDMEKQFAAMTSKPDMCVYVSQYMCLSV